jgi:tRNA threonylcarbamoyl adenosine modification protein YjeE
MTAKWRIDGVDLDGLDRLASLLALFVRPGDLVTLSGELGAGKTTFARALIDQVWGGAREEIVSPTFALAETYQTPRMPITHMDCYRLESASEVQELGLDEALDDGLVLLEWPERIASALVVDRLDITLEETDDEAARRLVLEGQGAWAPRLDRLRAMAEFLSNSGWQDADISYLQGDASARSYARLARGSERAVLMNSPRQPDGPAIRDGKPYSALAHLAEDVKPFVAMAQALEAVDLSAPEILAHDLEAGFLVIEDLGNLVFDADMAQGEDQEKIYRAAVDVLVALRRNPPPQELPLPGQGRYVLPRFDEEALGIEVELLLDWFWPALHGEPPEAAIRQEFMEIWGQTFAELSGQPEGWVLRDFHSPNLIWLPEREGLKRVGVIDFQDALRGSLAYDLASLLQDARQQVPAALEEALRAHYCRACEANDSNFNREEFLSAYAILGAQRNTKILGIFARLAKRDGKPGYLGHISRVSAYLERNLAHPILVDLKAWYDRHLPAETRDEIGSI